MGGLATLDILESSFCFRQLDLDYTFLEFFAVLSGTIGVAILLELFCFLN
jgi:hypothetical protein